MNTSLTTLDKSDLLRKISRQEERISKLEALLQGQAIGGVKIDSIAWDKAQGGTAVLGGLNNVDGKAEVRDALNNLVVLLDKSGVAINNGKLTIKNDSDVVSMDAKGIRSTTNFVQTETAAAGVNQTITGTGATDIPGSSRTITLTRSTLIVFLFWTQSYLIESVGNTGDFNFVLNIDGSSRAQHLFNAGSDTMDTRMSYYVAQFAAGTYTIKVQGDFIVIHGGSPSAVLYAYSWTYLFLGT